MFDENDLLNQIEGLLSKQAQESNVASNYRLALKMVDDLATRQAPAAVRPGAGPDNSQPAQSDLYSLNAFINYLKEKNFHDTNGLTVVAPTSEDAPIAKGYVRYESKDPAGLFLVNKQGVIDALKYFKGLESNNLYFQELIGNLVDQAKMDRQLNLPAEALTADQEKGDDALRLTDNTTLDTINTKVNVKQELYPDPVKGKITVGDLRDDAFPNFVSRFSLSMGGDTYVPLNYAADNSNENPICAFLNYLHTRASASNVARNLKNYYVSQLERFMGAKSCPIQPANQVQNNQNQQVNQKDQQGQENQQGQYQQVSYQVTQALQQGGSASFVTPYDIETDQFNFARMRAFAHQVDALMDVDAIARELKFYRNTLARFDDLVLDILTKLTDTAPPAFTYGGFSINVNTNLAALAATAGSYLKLLLFLEQLVPLCQNINNTLQALYESPTCVEVSGGKEVLDAQVQKGASYITWLGKYITDLREEITRHGNQPVTPGHTPTQGNQ